MNSIPVLKLGPLLSPNPDTGLLEVLVQSMREALTTVGFFYVSHHGISESLQEEILDDAARFFALPMAEKMKMAMPKAGLSWRGYFPPGGELTSGRPDQKEGIYFGQELMPDHPSVRAGIPLHGPNQWPEDPSLRRFRENVLRYLEALTQLGHVLMEGIALSLGLEREYFRARFGDDPTILFRIFSYSPHTWEPAADGWGVREHTDYGFLTILRQDANGGLQVKSLNGTWIEAPPIPGTFVINIGDMLEYWTHGLYRATPHRVRNQGKGARLSLPFFFDPGWKSTLERIDPKRLPAGAPVSGERWDKMNLHALPAGLTYGDFLWGKVKKVFPDLG